MSRGDFTIADVLAWARTKPADEGYPYWDIGNCAMCQFLRERGLPVRSAGGDGGWTDTNLAHHRPPQRIPLAATPHTFGGLVERLEALCPEPPKSDWLAIDAYMADVEQVSA